jgi:uroporphyrinogen decarboxylase
MQTDVRPRFLSACLGETPDVTPIWFMRQAGRSFPEYRKLRERHSMLELCHTPELAVEVTLQPVRRLGVDAAILFSDIVVVLEAMGVSLDIVSGHGPVIDDPIRTSGDLNRLRPIDAAIDLGYVMDTVKQLKTDLTVPLIGFAGAPFTLASYLVEGGPSKSHARTKALMYSDPQTWNRLMEILSQATLSYLKAQIDAGADAVQLFDSWVGDLAPGDYERSVASHVTRLFRELEATHVPRIYFGVGTGELLGLMAATGPEVMGIDWRVPLSQARRRVGPTTVLQGNLDPAACLAPSEVTARRATEVLTEGGGRHHIFNLGHGVLPQTDPGELARLVDHVHEWRRGD